MTKKTNEDYDRVVYRVFGDVGSENLDALEASNKTVLGLEYPFSAPHEVYIFGRNVHVYDVYQDGSFHYFDSETDKPAKEPDEMIDDRKRIVDTVEDSYERGFGGITGQNRASHSKYQKAFETLCKLGFGPQCEKFLDGRYLSRSTVLNHRVEYLGEDEPWIDVYEYDSRNGKPFTIYD